jgi:polyisoprenoid-binding protein YceI
LKSADFFDADTYPMITFKSKKAMEKDGKLHVTGDFSMHGVTKEITLPVEVLGLGMHPMAKAPVAGFSAEITLKRSDFGVDSWTDMAGVLGDEVHVSLLIEAIAKK